MYWILGVIIAFQIVAIAYARAAAHAARESVNATNRLNARVLFKAREREGMPPGGHSFVPPNIPRLSRGEAAE